MQIGHNLKAMIEYHFEQFSKHREEVKKIRNISKAKIEDHFEQFPKHREMVFNFCAPQPSKGNRGKLHYPQQYPQPIPQYNGINNSALLLSSSNHNIRTYQNAENFVEQLPYPQQSPPQHMFAPPNTLAFSGLNVNDNSVRMSNGSLGALPLVGATQCTFNNQLRAEKPQTLSPRPTWGQLPSEIPNDGEPYFDDFFQENFQEDFQQMSKQSQL
uniref:Uncharacterized protein n=1 Tax=Panagrolaimus davidi TaxID=227884 RepID=A0A914P947_9BILA